MLTRLLGTPMIVLSMLSANLIAAEDWGTLSGEIRVTGAIPRLPSVAPAAGLCPAVPVPEESLLVDSKSGGLQNVAIYLRSAPARIHPALSTVPVKPAQQFLQDCRFVPRMLLVRVGQDVEVFHDDPIDHSLRWHGFHNTINPGPAAANPEVIRMASPEKIPIKVTCDLHPYMTGWWLTLDHPYAAISNGQGEFRIPLLPVGEHELVIWHERKGYIHKSFRVTVEPGENVLPLIAVPITEFAAP